MKLTTPPVWVNVFVYFIVLALATGVARSFPVLDGLYFYFSISFLMSWILLRVERKKIADLGFIPKKKRDLLTLAKGIGLGMGMLLLVSLLTLGLTGNSWQFNPGVDPIYVLMLFLSVFWSCFVQEFTFRGYPFQRLFQVYGALVAQIAVAIPFGLMHVKYGMKMEEIGLTLLTTGAGSVLFGLAYLRNKRLFLPIGLHLGWNFAQALFPRSVTQGHQGLVTVIGSGLHENAVTILLPYLMVTVVFIWAISAKKI